MLYLFPLQWILTNAKQIFTPLILIEEYTYILVNLNGDKVNSKNIIIIIL